MCQELRPSQRDRTSQETSPLPALRLQGYVCVCVCWKCMRVTVIHMHIYITFQLRMCVCVCANHKAHSKYVILPLYVACVRVTPCPTSWQEEPAGYVGNVGPRGVNHRFRLTDELASAALTFTHTLSLSGLHSVTLSGWLSFTPSSYLCLLSISSFLLVSLFLSVSQSTSVHSHAVFQFVNPPSCPTTTTIRSHCLSLSLPLLFFYDRWVPQRISVSVFSLSQCMSFLWFSSFLQSTRWWSFMHAHICDECVSNICLFKCGFMTVIVLLSLKKMQKKGILDFWLWNTCMLLMVLNVKMSFKMLKRNLKLLLNK